MAHTRRQHRLRESVSAQRASVTSYTTTYSSAEIMVSCSVRRISLMSAFVIGEILSRKIRDRSASKRDTRHSRPNDVSISLIPASFDLVMNRDTLAGISALAPLKLVVRPLEMCKPPFAILGGVTTWVTGPFIVILLTAMLPPPPPPGLTPLEVPKECFDVLRVETFRAWEWFNLCERFILRFSWGWCWDKRFGPPRRRPPCVPGAERSVIMTVPSGCVLATGWWAPPFIIAAGDGATVVNICFNMAVTRRRRPFTMTSDQFRDIWWRRHPHVHCWHKLMITQHFSSWINTTRHQPV